MGSVQSWMIRCLLNRSNMWNKPVAGIRNEMEKVKTKGLPEGVIVEDLTLHKVKVKKIVPEDNFRSKVILYFHGGGFCLGIYKPNLEFVSRIAKDCGMVVYMPDYRLAPEYPFPAALEDAMACYKELILQGYKSEDIIVMGDSSGCGLALSALLLLRKRTIPMPRKLVLLTPVLDFAGTGKTFRTRAKKDPFRIDDPLGIAKIYVGDNNPTSSTISPIYGELEGLPPMLVHGADYDVFLSDSIRLYEKANKSGVEVELKVWEKMWHIFHMQANLVPESQRAMNELYDYVLN